jgi:hypothetical protein
MAERTEFRAFGGRTEETLPFLARGSIKTDIRDAAEVPKSTYLG